VGNVIGGAKIAVAVIGTGVTIAKCIEKVADMGKTAGKFEVVKRAMKADEFGDMLNTGLLRGGVKQSPHYVSPTSVSKDPLRARQRLALPYTPEVLVTIKVPIGAFSPASKIRPAFRMPGGGWNE